MALTALIIQSVSGEVCPVYRAKLGFAAHNASEADKLAALIEAIVTLQHTLDCPMNLTAFGVDRATIRIKA